MKNDYTSPELELIYVSADIITESNLSVEENDEFEFGDMDA